MSDQYSAPVEERGALVYLGAIRTGLFFGVDWRILIAITLIMLLSILAFHGGLIYGLVLWAVSGVLFIVGLTLGQVGPYLIDEFARYVEWRQTTGMRSVVPDDSNFAAPEAHFVSRWRS